MKTLIGLWQWVVTFIEQKLAWFSPLLARVSMGYVFIGSGWGKLHNIDRVTNFFRELGIVLPGANAYLVGATELICGIALVLGIFSRLAAFPLIIVMVVALATAKKGQLESMKEIFMLPEFLFIALLLWLITAGAGSLSLDRLLRKGK